MPWWHPRTPHQTDDAIAKHIAAEVKAGRIPLALAQMYEKALRDEADGKSTVMRNPQIKMRPPKRPSWG